MSPSPLLANATLALAVLASAMVQVSQADRQGVAWPGLTQLGVAVAVAVAVAALDRRGGAARAWGWGVCFAVLVLSPIAGNAWSRSAVGLGDPFEVVLVGVLRNLMLGLAAIRSGLRPQAIACLSSLFLVLFAFLWTMNTTTVALLIVYAVLGMWWLMGAYWDRLSGVLADRTESAVPVGPAGLAVGLALAGMLLAVPLARSSRFTTALDGFMPSSGGTEWTDDQAFGGLGDGDQMVKAKDEASSFGPIESELFLESEMPSLYDVFNELGEPAAPKQRSQKRAIALSPTVMQENHVHRGKTEQAGREFDAVRRRPNGIPPAGDRRSDALLHVTGRVPVHLALDAYDRWDGRKLSRSGEDRTVAVKLDNMPDPQGNRWLRPSWTLPRGLFTHADHRAIKFINLRSSTVPSPPQTDALMLDKANSVGMFGSTRDGDLRLDVEAIPQLTTLHLRSWVRPAGGSPTLRKSPPEGASDRVQALAAEWAAGAPEGWPQVQAVIDRLRSGYAHDRAGVAPADCDDVVEHFLFEARRGPDYLFAASAAVLLRTLGYETRVRSGFYARPENFNVLARSTAIYKKDAHFWVEVLASEGLWFTPEGESATGTWLTVEPTPGFETLYEPAGPWTIVAERLAALWRAIASRPLVATLAVAAAALAVWLRAAIADRMVTVWWLLVTRIGDPRQTVRATLRLLRRRAWLRRRPMPGTLGRWDLFPGRDDHQRLRSEFVEVASWALYSEGQPATAPTPDVRRVCHQVARRALRPRRPNPFRTTTTSLPCEPR